MTYEESMGMLTRLRDYEFVYREDAVTAHKMACEALEKQIPKRAVWRIEEDTAGYACPNCFMGVTIKLGHSTGREDFCSCCGQHIDWTNEK